MSSWVWVSESNTKPHSSYRKLNEEILNKQNHWLVSETTWTCKYGKSGKWQIMNIKTVMIPFNFLVSASSNQIQISSWNPHCTSKLWWLLFELNMKLKDSEYKTKCNDSTKNEANLVLNATAKCETFSVKNYFVRCIRNVDTRNINNVMHEISKISLWMDQQFWYSFRKNVLYVFSQVFFIQCNCKADSLFS